MRSSYVPPVVWSAIIVAASSDAFSASHSGAFLRAALTFVLGAPPEPDIFTVIHYLGRKAGHVIAYGILGALWFRALRASRVARAFVLACALATLVAAIDEAHQSTLQSRTGTPTDVALDLIGAAIGAGLVRRFSAPAASASPS